MLDSLYDPIVHFVCKYPEIAVIFQIHLFSLLSNYNNPTLNTSHLFAHKVI